MRGLRIAAWAVAAATFVFMALGVVGVASAMSWLPFGLKFFVAVAFLAPVTVGG